MECTDLKKHCCSVETSSFTPPVNHHHSINYDLLPAKRQRNARVSDAGVVPRSPDADIRAAGLPNTTCGSGARANWCPSVSSSSVWRSVPAAGRPNCHLSPLGSCLSSSSCHPSEHSTPTTSQSPSPRPGSASSGFFDSSVSSLVDNTGARSRRSFVQSFSEMLEFQLTLSGVNGGDGAEDLSSESLPMLPDRLSPSSSQTTATRCHSQPTVLFGSHRTTRRGLAADSTAASHHSRRLSRSSNTTPGTAGSKKRRWPLTDECRPKLDFLKMTEVSSHFDKILLLFCYIVIFRIPILTLLGCRRSTVLVNLGVLPLY